MRSLLLLLLMIPGLVTAKEEVIRLGIIEQLPPYTYKTCTALGYEGINIDIIREVIYRLNKDIKIKVIEMPKIRVAWAIKNDLVDIVFIDSKLSMVGDSEEDEETKKRVSLTGELYTMEMGAFIRRHSMDTSGNFYKDKTIGILGNNRYNVDYTSVINGKNIHDIRTPEQLYGLLMNARFDIVISEQLSFVYHVRHNGEITDIELVDSLGMERTHLAVINSNNVFSRNLNEVNDIIDFLVDSGLIGTIFKNNLIKH